jgi:hypothetical protein
LDERDGPESHLRPETPSWLAQNRLAWFWPGGSGQGRLHRHRTSRIFRVKPTSTNSIMSYDSRRITRTSASKFSVTLLLISVLTVVGCGSGSSNRTHASQFLYVTGATFEDRSQIFGYRIQSDGSLALLNLSPLTAIFCCHQATSVSSVLYAANFTPAMAPVAPFSPGIGAFGVDTQVANLVRCRARLFRNSWQVHRARVGAPLLAGTSSSM